MESAGILHNTAVARKTGAEAGAVQPGLNSGSKRLGTRSRPIQLQKEASEDRMDAVKNEARTAVRPGLMRSVHLGRTTLQSAFGQFSVRDAYLPGSWS